MLHEADQLHLENCKMGQKVESSQRVKNEEQRREKWEILIGWVHIVNLVWGEKEQEVSTETRAGLAFGAG